MSQDLDSDCEDLYDSVFKGYVPPPLPQEKEEKLDHEMIAEIQKSIYYIPIELANRPKLDQGFMDEPVDLSMPEIPSFSDLPELLF